MADAGKLSGGRVHKRKKKKRGMSSEQAHALAMRRREKQIREQKEEERKQQRTAAAERRQAAVRMRPRRPAPIPERLMEEIADPFVLEQAVRRTAQKRQAGIDGVAPSFLPVLIPDVSVLREDLLAGTYTPSPVVIHGPGHPGYAGPLRGTLTAADSAVQRAMCSVFARHLADSRRIYLDLRSETSTVRQCIRHADSGLVWVLTGTVVGYEQPQAVPEIMSLLRTCIPDDRAVELAAAFMQAGRVVNGKETGVFAGLSGSGTLRSLCSEMIMRITDHWLRDKKVCFVRRTDQIMVFCGSQKEGREAQETVESVFSACPVPLMIRDAKLTHLSAADFLGFGFFKEKSAWGAKRLTKSPAAPYRTRWEDRDALKNTLGAHSHSETQRDRREKNGIGTRHQPGNSSMDTSAH